MTNRRIFTTLVTLAFFYIASPLLFPIVMGAVIAVLFYPLLVRLEEKRISTSVASGLLTFAITVIFILPTSFLVFFTVKAALQQLQALKASQVHGEGTAFFDSVLDSSRVQGFMKWVTDYLPLTVEELNSTFREWAGSVGTKITDFLGGVISYLPGLTMALIVMVVSIYFWLVDGRKLLYFVRRHSIFSVQQTEKLIRTLEGICRSVILASLLAGGAQALVEVTACALTGTPNAVLVGLCVFIASFIPIVGASPVTLGVGLEQLFEPGRQTQGIILIVCGFVIMGIDNMVRPLFLRGSANLHPLLAFVAALGGLQMLGFLGVFLGPILAALFVATIQVVSEVD
jgi:predicted PurR-regulated permease PerM